MSGCLAVSRKACEEALPNLANVGFKIMLDLLASAQHPLRTAEIPYTFRTRSAGESKLDANVGQEFIILLPLGRASCRVRVWPYVTISLGAALIYKTHTTTTTNKNELVEIRQYCRYKAMCKRIQ